MTQYSNDTKAKFKRDIEDKVVFFFVTIGVVTLTLGFFVLIDFLPEKPTHTDNEISVYEDALVDETIDESETTYTPKIVAENIDPLPVSIYIDALDREVEVLNPESNSIEVLDEALLSGVVRHPDSANFQNTGTIFLLGHSSYLPNVINRNFQAFNGIQKLEWGDIVRLRSNEVEYVYRVDKVYEAKASSAEVPLQFEDAKLVLATCNSFGSKDDRYVVEASLIAKKSLISS